MKSLNLLVVMMVICTTMIITGCVAPGGGAGQGDVFQALDQHSQQFQKTGGNHVRRMMSVNLCPEGTTQTGQINTRVDAEASSYGLGVNESAVMSGTRVGGCQ